MCTPGVTIAGASSPPVPRPFRILRHYRRRRPRLPESPPLLAGAADDIYHLGLVVYAGERQLRAANDPNESSDTCEQTTPRTSAPFGSRTAGPPVPGCLSGGWPSLSHSSTPLSHTLTHTQHARTHTYGHSCGGLAEWDRIAADQRYPTLRKSPPRRAPH